jgi:flagellar export protein FliJ
MSDIYALEKIKNLYALKYDAAITKVAILEKEYSDARKQLDEILSYYQEYCDMLKRQTSNGLNIYQLKNQHQFINQFTPVITQQKKMIEKIKGKIADEKNNLYDCYKDLKALEHILDKKNAIVENLKAKKEVARQEEEFVNMHINKK